METNNLKLPLLKPNDTGKEFIVNEAFKLIDDFSVIKNGVSIDGSNATFNSLSVQSIHNIFLSNTADWTQPIQKVWNTEYIADEDGYINVFGNLTTEVSINGKAFSCITGTSSTSIERSYRIIKGDIYKGYGSGGVPWIRFYRLRKLEI